ncbi:MAG: hypothetical protein NT076_03185 [Candidatus Pacearchaeota archaeon]|nr:hypothetical protein [Candidatus Pacearchaeota archaeon]
MRKKLKNALETVKGAHTLESVITLLNLNRIKAIKLLSALRKKGYVKTKRLSNNKRLYDISFENRLNGKSYINVLNAHSPIKITTSEVHRVYGKEISLGETLILAIKSRSLRQILASLALFKKIKDWPLLYRLAKAEGLERQVGALYDLSRKIMKTRKMTRRFQNLTLPKKNERYLYIIGGLNSEDFKEIEKKWKVYLPFNRADLEAYK